MPILDRNDLPRGHSWSDPDARGLAVVRHHGSEQFPLGGIEVAYKEPTAESIVAALNAYEKHRPHYDEARLEVVRCATADVVGETALAP